MDNKDLMKLLYQTQEDGDSTPQVKRIIMIDALNLFFRNFAVLGTLNSNGAHVGGLGGFFRSLGALIKNIDNIPYPARDLLNIEKHASMITSRGCPYNCAFCSTSRFSRNQVRYHSAAYVAEEIELVYKDYKPEYITIYDDLFAMDTKRVIEIHKLLAAKNLIGKIDFAFTVLK